MANRQKLEWYSVHVEGYDEVTMWKCGDWVITNQRDGYRLLVSSSVIYGPFRTLADTLQKAEDVRGD